MTTTTKQSPSTANEPASLSSGPLDVYKHRWLFIGLSLLFLLPGLYFIGANMANPQIAAPLRLGIDFKGGTLLEYGFTRPVKQDDIPAISDLLEKQGYTGSIIQIQDNHPAKDVASTGKPETAAPLEQQDIKPTAPPTPTNPSPKPSSTAPTATLPLQRRQPAPLGGVPMDVDGKEMPVAKGVGDQRVVNVVSIRSKQLRGQDDITIRKNLEARFGPITVLQKVSMGPALARELFTNGLLALGLAYLLIMGYLTFRFQFDFAVCAMAALLHDTVFLIGMFALFGALFNTEVDSLFVTAVLTVVGFSVHDTIVVFDRIRENMRVHYTKKLPFVTIVNASVNQTLTRSVNTSLTALLTMLALYFFGGETTRDFVLAIIIGIAAGTYSSIFNASVLLAMWRTRSAKAA